MKIVRISFEGFEKDKRVISNYALMGDHNKKSLMKKIDEIIEEVFGNGR